MRFWPSQAVREAHPVSVHEFNFQELHVDTDTRSYWKVKSAGAASSDRWERLSGPLQDIPDAPSTTNSGYIAEDATLYIYGRWEVDSRKQVDGRVVILRSTHEAYAEDGETVLVYGRWQVDNKQTVDGRVVLVPPLDAPKTVLRTIGVGRTITIPEAEQLVMLGPLQLDGRLICNGNLAFA